MRMRNVSMLAALAACGVMAMAGGATAESIEDLNSFAGQSGWYYPAAATSSPVYSGFSQAPALVNTTNNAPPFIFADGNQPKYVNVSGLNGTSLSALRLFDDGWDPRTPTSVSVYYSSANTQSLDPGQYTPLGTTMLSVNGNNYPNLSSNANDIGQTGNTVHFVDVPAAIPTGTKSILLELACANPVNGGALQQIQGIVGADLLLGKPVTTSSVYNPTMPAVSTPATVTDGVSNEFAFSDGDPAREMAITGFNSAVNLVRVWAVNDRLPTTVMIASTTVANSTDPNDYSLLTTVSNLAFNSQGFADIAVSAPAGTQGLGFVWGAGSNQPGTGISEIQAFAAGQVVPEPSALVLLACAVMSLLAYRWKRCK